MTENQPQQRLAAVILAAGKGTRMDSNKAKVLHPVCDKPMVLFPVAAARALGAEKIVLVVGHQAAQVKRAVADDTLIYAHQEQQLGTGHAVLQAKAALQDFKGTVLILCGDVPLLKPSTLAALLASHRESAAATTVLTALVPDPRGYGRVITDDQGQVLKIVEEGDATEEEKKVTEINTGIYCVENNFLFHALNAVDTNNVQQEYYLTDIVAIAVEKHLAVRSHRLADHREAMGINTPTQLEEANRIMEKRMK